jgi:hypothetical protein
MSHSKGKQQFALGVGVFGAVAWLVWLIWILPSLAYEILNTEILTALIPFVAILLAWWRHVIGGCLVVLSGFAPLIVMFSYYQSNTGDQQLGIAIFIVPVLASTTAALIVSGILFLILGIRQRQSPEPEQIK